MRTTSDDEPGNATSPGETVPAPVLVEEDEDDLVLSLETERAWW